MIFVYTRCIQTDSLSPKAWSMNDEKMPEIDEKCSNKNQLN